MNEYFQKQIDGRSGVEDNMTLFYTVVTDKGFDDRGMKQLTMNIERLAFTVGDIIKLEDLEYSHVNPKAPSIPIFRRK